MAAAESNGSSSSLNGDAVLEVSVHDLENNTELVVLPKAANNDLGPDVGENTATVVRDRFSDGTCLGEASAACENKSPGSKVDAGRASNARSSKQKCGGNTYVVSADSDDDRNAECITMYRGEVIDVSDNSDSSDSDTSSTVSDENDDSDNVSIRSSSDTDDRTRGRVMRTQGELSMQDLPPIEDLKISVDESQCKPVGSVLNIVEEMVVIQSFPNTPALDIDTVLFLDRGQRALGKIFDVFGPVQEPFYGVRFNSREHIQERDIRREQVVYCAPQTKYTSYIQVAQLLKEKGSDASWRNNNEPPVACLDFSDDEAEARHKRPKANTGSKRGTPSDNDLFVKKMNQRNLELTAKRRKEDEAKKKRGSMPRKVATCARTQPGESLINATVHPFAPFSKSRSFGSGSGGDQACSSSFFHHPAASAVMANTHPSTRSKYESSHAPRVMNYLRNAAAAAAAAAVSYTSAPSPPVSYTFPTAPHFVRSSTRQLPNPAQPSSTAAAAAAAATQNYLAMFHHQRAQPMASVPTAALPMVQSPFSHFGAPGMPPMPGYVAQPQLHPAQTQPRHAQTQPHPAQTQPHPAQTQPQAAMHPVMPPSFNVVMPPPPPPFAGFSSMHAAPSPSSVPQPSFFAARTDTGGVSVHHPASYMPLGMRPAVPATFHPPFVLPPPPPPPPPPVTPPVTPPGTQEHQRDVPTASRPFDRTNQTTNTFYPSSPGNS